MENNNLFNGRYFFERMLGRGNFSEVWLAKDVQTDIEVALKIYAPATGLDNNGLQMLSREFAIVVNANHSNLLKPLYYDVCDRKPFLVLPFCKSGSIIRYVGRFTEEDTWHLLHDVASGLAFLHSMGTPIIHQDIKPDNIMIGEAGQYQITDFGVSAHSRSTLRKTMSSDLKSAGTTAYMAPERFGKSSQPQPANDIWSLGVMAYEMLTGDVPFGDHGGLLQKQGADIPDLPSNRVSPNSELSLVLHHCLAEAPEDRPTAEQLTEWAEKGLRGEKIFPSFWHKHRTAVVGIVCGNVLLLLILLLIWKIVSHKSGLDLPDEGTYAYACYQLKDAKQAEDGLKLIQEFSAEGNDEATYLLSQLYFKSLSPRDYQSDSIMVMKKALNLSVDNNKAHELLLKTIEQNPLHYHALYELGCDYLGGEARTEAVRRNIPEADKCLKRALEIAKEQNDNHYVELISVQIARYSDEEENNNNE